MPNIEISFRQVDVLPSTGLVVGCIYFEKSTGKIYIAQTETTAVLYGKDLEVIDCQLSGSINSSKLELSEDFNIIGIEDKIIPGIYLLHILHTDSNLLVNETYGILHVSKITSIESCIVLQYVNFNLLWNNMQVFRSCSIVSDTPVEWTTWDIITSYTRSLDNSGSNYTAGDNILIHEGNIISAIGYTYDKGIQSFAEGYNLATGSKSHAEGDGTSSTAVGSHSEGVGTHAGGDASHAEGSGSIASGYGAHSEGFTIASGKYSHAEGSNEVPIWRRFRVMGWNRNTPAVYYVRNMSLKGSNGTEYITNGACSTYLPTICDGFVSNGLSSGASKTTFTSGNQTVAIVTDPAGTSTKCMKLSKTVQGQLIFEFWSDAKSGAGYTYSQKVLGFLPAQTYTFKCDIYIPKESEAALDYTKYGVGLYAWNGENFHGDYEKCTVLGKWTTITLEVPVKKLISEASGVGSHVEGTGCLAAGQGSHAEGAFTFCNGPNSHVEGTSAILAAQCSHAEGSGCLSFAHNSHAEGECTWTDGDGAHAEGRFTIAFGDGTHSEGYATLVTRNDGGLAGHAEGYQTCVGNNYGHAEGYAEYLSYKELTISSVSGTTITFNTTSHGIKANEVYRVAPIKSTWWIGKTHIFPDLATAVQKSSGYTPQEVYSIVSVSGATITVNKNVLGLAKNKTYGFYLTEGASTGIASHSEGYRCNVISNYSHVEGYCNVANTDYQHVQGKYNEIDSKKELVDIIGWGTEDKRKNIEVTKNDGTKWLANDVTCGGTYTTPEHKLSEKVGLNDLKTINGIDLKGPGDIKTFSDFPVFELIFENSTNILSESAYNNSVTDIYIRINLKSKDEIEDFESKYSVCLMHYYKNRKNMVTSKKVSKWCVCNDEWASADVLSKIVGKEIYPIPLSDLEQFSIDNRGIVYKFPYNAAYILSRYFTLNGEYKGIRDIEPCIVEGSQLGSYPKFRNKKLYFNGVQSSVVETSETNSNDQYNYANGFSETFAISILGNVQWATGHRNVSPQKEIISVGAKMRFNGSTDMYPGEFMIYYAKPYAKRPKYPLSWHRS